MTAIDRPAHDPSRRLALATAGALAALLGLIAAPSPVLASDPMGIYTFVDEVTIEPPKAGEPLKVRIDGVSALSYRPKEGGEFRGGVYSDPAAGYLYFFCPPGKEVICQSEWADLGRAKGGPLCAAYGGRYLTDPEANGILRPATQLPSDPDTYPIAQGVTLVEHGMDGTCDAIKEFIAQGGTPDAPPATPAEDTPTAAPPTEEPTIAALAPTATVDAFLPSLAQDGQPQRVAPDGMEPEVATMDGDAYSTGGGSGTLPSPALVLLGIVGLGALALLSAGAWSRTRRP